jgi:antirestriction protein ArdC
MPSQTEIRQQITNQIIEALEKGGIPPWRMGWSSSPNGRGNPANVASKRAYSGVNIWLLRLHAQKYCLRSRWFGSFAQWKSLGCSVKPRPAGVEPGRWGASVVLYKPLKKKEIDKKTGEEVEVEIPLLRTFNGLFSADQVHGAERWQVGDEPAGHGFVDFEPAETALSAYPADVRFGGDRAYYSMDGDYIQMPSKGRFTEEHEYYGTLAHEMAHHSESRLGWKGEYAIGELRAEIASAYVLAELGVPQSDDLTNVTAYLKSWLKSLRDDASYIFKASSAASKAADHILSCFRSQEAVEEPEAALAV